MLGLLFMNIFVFFVFSVCGWYSKLWALTFACFFSFLELYFSCWGLEKCSFYIFQDSMSLSLVSLSFWVTMMMMLASQSSVKLKDNSIFFFSQVLLVLNLIVVLCFCVSSVFLFYFFFEASLIPTLVLILGWGYQPERLQAGMYMMIYTIGASLPLLLVIVWFNYMICSSDIMVVNLCRGNFFIDLVVDFLAFLIFSAFLVKLPLFSVHLWLPKAHVEAPVAGSMVLAAILLKLGGYGLLRMHQYFNFFGCNFSVLISVLALWGGIMTSIICFRQVDFKSLVAYSSIGHMSLIVAGVFSNSVWGWMGSLVVMISHGFSSSGLFVLSNLSYEKTNSRSLFLSKGLLMLIPNLAMWWFLFCCMNMAAPPSINLFGEIIIFFSVIFSSWFYVGCVGFMSFLAAFYSMYLYVCMQHGGGPKYLSFSKSMDSFNYDLLILHWLPGNLFILKNELVLLWF